MPNLDVPFLPGSSPTTAVAVAFDVVFGLFVVAFVVLAVITIMWAVRRDRAGRAAWARRHGAAEEVDDGRVAPPMANGDRPWPRRQTPSEHSD